MFFSKNLKHLRRKKNKQTQESLAKNLGVTRSVISSYEDGRAEPSITTLTRIATYFQVSIDNLTNLDLANVDEKKVEHQRQIETYASAKNLHVETVVIDDSKQRYINLVPEKASAGYTSGYTDIDYLKDLPTYRLPFLSNGKVYRAFEITGDSMLPLMDQSIVIGEYIEAIEDIKDGQACIVVSKNEGIVLKKVYNKISQRNTLLLKSANVAYSPYEIKMEEVLEIWRFVAYISQKFPEEYDSSQDLREAFARMEYEIQEMKTLQIG